MSEASQLVDHVIIGHRGTSAGRSRASSHSGALLIGRPVLDVGL